MSDTSTVTAEQDFLDAVYDNLIDQAYRDVMLRMGHSSGQKELSIGLDAGQMFYTTETGTDIAVVPSQMRLRPPSTNLTVPPTPLTDRTHTIDRILIPISQEEARVMMGGGEFVTEATMDLPLYWWPEGRSSVLTEPVFGVGIWPAPTAAQEAAGYQLVFRFDNFGVRLVGESSRIESPIGTDVAIVNLVASWLKGWLGDLRESARFYEFYDATMLKVVGRFGNENHVSPSRPVDVYRIL